MSKSERNKASRRAAADQTQDYVPSTEESTTGSPRGHAETVAGAPAEPESDRSPSQAAWIGRDFGRYRILRELGRGAMGVVYLAHDAVLDRQVAVKIPKFTAADGSEEIERFYREARAMAALQHPNLCGVYDVGEIEGVHYLTMAYIEGKPLSAFLKGEKSHPQRQVAAVLRTLALALEEAHKAGLVHRDLKPSNIMINRKSEPVIMDFGLARRQKENESTLTAAGTLLGTPSYMSPEQASGDQDRVGPVTDVYALGVIGYQLLTGRLPFRGTITQVLIQIVSEKPPQPSLISDQTLDPALEAICMKAMSRRPEDRFGSAGELAEALRGFLAQTTSTRNATRKAARKRQSSSASDGPSQAEKLDESSTEAKSKPGTSMAQPAPAVPPPVITSPDSPPPPPAASMSGQDTGDSISESRGESVTDQLAEDFFAQLAQDHPSIVGEVPVFESESARETILPSARRKRTPRKSGGAWQRIPLPMKLLLIVAPLLCLVALSFLAIRIATNRGEVVIRSYDPQLELLVSHNGQLVDEFQLGQRERQLSYRSGKYEIAIKGGSPRGVTVRNGQFQLSRGGSEVVEILREEGSPRIVASTTPSPAPQNGSPAPAPAPAPDNATTAASSPVIDTVPPEDDFKFQMPESADQIAAQWVTSLQGSIGVVPQGGELVELTQVPESLFHLETLSLPAGAELQVGELKKLNSLTRLRAIDLGKAVVPAGTLADLAVAPALRSLTLGANSIDEAELPQLGKIRQLRRLDLTDAELNSSEVLKLHEQLPRCEILYRDAGQQKTLTPDTSLPEVADAPFDEKMATQLQQQWADYLAAPVEQTNSLGMTLKLIPPGEYTMGSPGGGDSYPPRRVRITRPFYISAYETTQQQFTDLMGRNTSVGVREPDHPVGMVSWHSAVAFCNKLSESEDLQPCYSVSGQDVSVDLSAGGYRLPTEAEWEYCCRAGTTTAWFWGDDPAQADQYAWYNDNSGRATHPVGQKQPNAFGLYDMVGNNWEWCYDWYAPYEPAAGLLMDPLGPPTGDRRVERGRFWISSITDLDSSLRHANSPRESYNAAGIRVVRSAE